jgi:hypothetical protein
VLTGHQEQSRSYESQTKFCLTVLFTSVKGTLTALREAARIAPQLSAGIRILVPYVVPYPLPIDQPRVDPLFRLRQFRTVCEQESIATRIDIRLCRDALQCVGESLPPDSLILVGISRNWWPFNQERRLMRCLTAAGYEVVPVREARARRSA